MSSANDLRKGQVIKFKQRAVSRDWIHSTARRGTCALSSRPSSAISKNGRSFDQRFNSTETMDVLTTDRRTLEFSYANSR